MSGGGEPVPAMLVQTPPAPVFFASVEAPLPSFQDVNAAAIAGLSTQRQALLQKFGWKASYGPLVPTKEGDARRAAAVQRADDWFFAQLGRATAVGQRYQAMREYFEMAKIDFKWKRSYGPLVPQAKGNAKRAEAVRKAIKYTAEKFSEDPAAVEAWVVMQ